MYRLPPIKLPHHILCDVPTHHRMHYPTQPQKMQCSHTEIYDCVFSRTLNDKQLLVAIRTNASKASQEVT